MHNRDDTTVSTLPYGANSPVHRREPVINRATRRHEKALLRKAAKRSASESRANRA